MFKNALLAIAGACLMIISGCNQGDTEVRSVLATACPAANDAYAYYAAIAAAGVLSQRTVDRVEFAKGQIDRLCANPETATVAGVLAAGALTYARVQDAIKEAKANGAAVGYSGDLRKLEDIAARIKKEMNHAR